MKYELVFTKNTKKIPKVLREKSKEVKKIIPEILDLVDQMIKVMDENKGIGISAVQVGVPIRVIVVKDCDQNHVLINPKLKSFTRKEVAYNEGCLSFPDIFEDITRPEGVVVTAKNLDWKDMEVNADGLFARCLLHELDHLEGVVFLDKISKYQNIKFPISSKAQISNKK